MSLTLHLKSSLATSLTNIDGSHTLPASHHERFEGWTEVFGNYNGKTSIAEDERCDFGYDWRQDDYYVFRTRNANVHPSMMSNPPSIRIDQYRPSFAIQLYLRLTCTPHLVFNSSNSCTESNGPLPVLTDLDHRASVSTSTSTIAQTQHSQSRIGGIFSYLLEKRNGDKNTRSTNTDFTSNYEYYDNNNYGNVGPLEDVEDVTTLTFDQKVQKRFLISQYHELTMIIKCLRYGHDTTWNDLYRKQSIRAHLYPNGDPDEMLAIGSESNYEKRGWSFLTWFQIWAERSVAKNDIQSDTLGKELFVDGNLNQNQEYAGGGGGDGAGAGAGVGGGKEVNVKKALFMAGEIYSNLDYKLGESRSRSTATNETESGTLTLLGTESLSLIDVLLFGHLAEALCDVHLVTILAGYKNLVSFFQCTYERYFGKEYQVNHRSHGINKSSSQPCPWIKWNDRMNALNQFNRIPMNDVVGRNIRSTLINKKSGSSYNDYQGAIQIMQSVALHCHDLGEILADVALLRRREDGLYGMGNVPKSIVGKWLYELRMGADLDTGSNNLEGSQAKSTTEGNKGDEQDDMTKKNEELRKKVLREAKKNDELWISATIAATVIGLLASARSSSG